MASTIDFVEYVCEQMEDVGEIAYRKMFGDYCVYCNKKVIGLICDNQFFVKKTKTTALLYNLEEGPPYPGAKPHFIVDFLEDKEMLVKFVLSTYQELPLPKVKKKK